MIEQQPLRGTALYNPHLHGKDELISLFVARREILALLVEDLRATDSGKTPQHHLILGQRGMGKTMLLRRLAFAIEDDPALGQGWLPLTFPEEQYNVAHLSDFWLNCADALSDFLESKGRHSEAHQLDEAAEALRSLGEETRAKRALALLVDTARRIERRLVLLVDNADLVLERVGEQEWTLREALSMGATFVLIGASANAIESSFNYGKAFYDFFRVHELGGLSLDETRQLLIHYAEALDIPEVGRVANEEPTRIKVLHNLTGGNPRTIALLFNVLAAGGDDDVRTDLERLLDQSTPLYKARFEALPPQAQQVVHALAVHWDPISAAELAGQLAMDVNAVSSQLARLVKQGVVEKVAYDPETKTGFQIGERFFNIWYLMRASRRVRRRLLWLVEFLRMFYSQEQLRARALLHIQAGLALDAASRLRYAEYGFALADAINDTTWSNSLERTGVYALAGETLFQSHLNELFDHKSEEPDLRETAEQLVRLERARPRFIAACAELTEGFGEELWVALKDAVVFPLTVKATLAEKLPSIPLEQLKELRAFLVAEPDRLDRTLVCASTASALATAVRTGLMTALGDAEGAMRAESILGVPGLQAVSLAHIVASSQNSDLLAILEGCLDGTTSPYPWLVWLRHLSLAESVSSKARIERAVQRIYELAKHSSLVFRDLGEVLRRLSCFDDSEKALRKAVELDSANAPAWFSLGMSLFVLGRLDEAEAAFTKSGSLQPDDATNWLGVGLARVRLGRFEEAEDAVRRALVLAPSDALVWGSLGIVLASTNQGDEAEEATRRAIEFSDTAATWFFAGMVAHIRRDLLRAEEAFRHAIERDSSDAHVWFSLAELLSNSGRLEEAEIAYRTTLRLEPGVPNANESLAWLLIEQSRFSEAGVLAALLADQRWEAVGIRAAVLAHEGKWDEAAPCVRSFLSRAAGGASSWRWSLVLSRVCLRSGRARETLEILEETGVAERMRPLAEALRAAVRGRESYLRRVAPEVRGVARQVLAQLLEPVGEETGTMGATGKKRPRKRARPRKGGAKQPAGLPAR